MTANDDWAAILFPTTLLCINAPFDYKLVLHRNNKHVHAYPKYYCDRLCNALNFPHCRSIFILEAQWRSWCFRLSSYVGNLLSVTRCAPCGSLTFPHLIYSIGAFCFEFRNAKCLRAALLSAAAVSGPFYFLHHSEFYDVRKWARIHTHTQIQICEYYAYTPSFIPDHVGVWFLIFSFCTHLCHVPGFLSAPPLFFAVRTVSSAVWVWEECIPIMVLLGDTEGQGKTAIKASTFW